MPELLAARTGDVNLETKGVRAATGWLPRMQPPSDRARRGAAAKLFALLYEIY
jgi:hypothetical protein